MSTRDPVPVRIVLTLGMDEAADVRRIAGEVLSTLTRQAEVKRAQPMRIQHQVERPDGGLEWRDLEYWRQEAVRLCAPKG